MTFFENVKNGQKMKQFLFCYAASDRAHREDSNALGLASGGRNLTPVRGTSRFSQISGRGKSPLDPAPTRGSPPSAHVQGGPLEPKYIKAPPPDSDKPGHPRKVSIGLGQRTIADYLTRSTSGRVGGSFFLLMFCEVIALTRISK